MQASLIGMQRQMAVSVRSCGICGGDLEDFGAVVSARDAAAGVDDAGGYPGKGASVQLGCKHCFHPDCIRGWTIVGKKVRRRLWLRAKHGVSRMLHQAASQLCLGRSAFGSEPRMDYQSLHQGRRSGPVKTHVALCWKEGPPISVVLWAPVVSSRRSVP